MVDTMRFDQYKRTDSVPSNYSGGSQAVYGNNADNATFQTYLLKLNPHIIINDGVSLKGMITTGYGMGGFLGDEATNTQGTSAMNGMLYNSSPSGDSTLSLAQFYAEIYSDTGLYRVGRFAKSWGLGAIYNAGTDHDDRFFTLYDGIELEYRLGKFYFKPYYAKINTANALTRDAMTSEVGVSAEYDNPDNNTKLGLLYAKREIGSSTNIQARDEDFDIANTAAQTHNIGGAKIKLIDVYAEKSWDKITAKIEVPIFSGDAGNIYNATTFSSFKARAYLGDLSYASSGSWKYGLLAGSVSGDDGQTNAFEALSLNPNFQVAQLMFRYNLDALQNRNSRNSLFDSAVSNATFARLYARYASETVAWNFAFIWAKAQEVGKAGSQYYNHERGYRTSTAMTTNQSDDLGYEVDISFDYFWNPNVTITGFLGYHFVGDYYKYTGNTGDPELNLKNPFVTGLRMAVNF